MVLNRKRDAAGETQSVDQVGEQAVMQSGNAPTSKAGSQAGGQCVGSVPAAKAVVGDGWQLSS